ncbi:RHS repeat-associated core domain-containing protein [Gordonia asplenii]
MRGHDRSHTTCLTFRLQCYQVSCGPDQNCGKDEISVSVWGQTRWVGASTVLRFAGQQYDAETGLHYNRYRYCKPVTSAYTSTDPLGAGPNPASATAYVHNPYTWIDPLGLKSVWARQRLEGRQGSRARCTGPCVKELGGCRQRGDSQRSRKTNEVTRP